MNINNVFEAELWMLLRRDYEKDNCICSCLRKTLLYRNKYNDYYDLYTKRKYQVGNCFCVPGDVGLQNICDNV